MWLKHCISISCYYHYPFVHLSLNIHQALLRVSQTPLCTPFEFPSRWLAGKQRLGQKVIQEAVGATEVASLELTSWLNTHPSCHLLLPSGASPTTRATLQSQNIFSQSRHMGESLPWHTEHLESEMLPYFPVPLPWAAPRGVGHPALGHQSP